MLFAMSRTKSYSPPCPLITISVGLALYSSTTKFSSGSSLKNISLNEKATLEDQLLTGTPGFGDADPPVFFVG